MLASAYRLARPDSAHTVRALLANSSIAFEVPDTNASSPSISA
jgi:hypothetical protein